MTPRKPLRRSAASARIDTKKELLRVAEALDKAPQSGEKRFELLRRQAELGDLRDERIEQAWRDRQGS